jgi:diguanylate cyclase (GGDEF)-like protein/PAS domain S-box-containing protein
MNDADEQEHEALLQFLYLAPVGLVQATLDGAVMMMNPLSAQLLLPLSPGGDLSNLFTALESVAPELRGKVESFTGSRGPICENYRAQLTAGVKDNKDPCYLSVTLIKLDATRLMGVVTDITQLVKQERQLRQSKAWFNAILTGVTDYALTTVDDQGRVESWNQSVARLTGYSEASVVGAPFSLFYPPDSITAEYVADRIYEAEANGWSFDDGWLVRADGARFWGSVMLAPLEDRSLTTETRNYALIVRDITDKRDAADQMRGSDARDFLTGLPTRRAFFEAAELLMQRWKRLPRPLSLVMFDCDHFKAVNDQYGHPAGDEVLRHFANRLREACRGVDMVARMGGEEFAALLPSTDAKGAVAFAGRIRTAVVDSAVTFDGRPIRYTVSAGVSTMTADLAGLDALIKRADEALYKAKGAGRNRVELAVSA